MMDNTTPHWLDGLFLTKVLQSMEDSKPSTEVIQFWCQPAVAPGSNYLSQLYRVSVDYKTAQDGTASSISLIVKTPLEPGEMKEFVERVNGYTKEVNIYNKILPKMYELHDSKVTARSFYCPLYCSLVLEDLRVRGYVLADRLKQLDFSHCYQLLVSMAKLHALSVATHHQCPQLIEGVGRSLYYRDRVPDKEQRQLREMSNGFLRAMASTIKKLEGCEHYALLVLGKLDSYWEEMVKLARPRKGLNVLNHGDAWITNMMFKYNEAREVIDAKFVDFQLAHFCSFAFDLIYFWWTSADEQVREHCREELFEVYRQTLNKTLCELNCRERLSKEEFNRELRTCAKYSICVLGTILPFAMADPEEFMELDQFSPDDFCKESLNDDSPEWKNFQSKYYKAVLPKMLKQVEEFGAFD